MRRLQVKICGMRDAANIADIASLGADYMGFIFVPSSPRYVGKSFDARNFASLPSTTKRVGVFKNNPLELLVETIRRYSLDVVQLHGSENDMYLKALKTALPNTTIFKAISVSAPESIASLTTSSVHPDAYLMDSGSGGTGTTFDWRRLRSYELAVPFILAGGIGLHNVDEIVNISADYPQLLGIDINSRAEREVAIKDKEILREIFKRLGR